MSINYRVSKIYKLVDGTNNKPIDNAVVAVINSNGPILNKNNGFYVVCNIDKGDYRVNISANGYKPIELPLGISLEDTLDIELILLEVQQHSNGSLDKKIIKGNLYKDKKLCCNKTFYYFIEKKGYAQRIVLAANEQDKSIKLVSTQLPLEYRKIAIEGVEGIYTIEECDYTNNTYSIKEHLKQNVKAGALVYILNLIRTDESGNYSLAIDKDDIHDEKLNVWFVEENDQLKKEIVIDKNNYNIDLEMN